MVLNGPEMQGAHVTKQGSIGLKTGPQSTKTGQKTDQKRTQNEPKPDEKRAQNQTKKKPEQIKNGPKTDKILNKIFPLGQQSIFTEFVMMCKSFGSEV